MCGGVVLSLAVGNESCSWVRALVHNALDFSRSTTRVVVHLSSSASLCSDEEISAINGSHHRAHLNPVRLQTVAGSGLVLYAHLSNARFAAAMWPEMHCSYLVMQASNMLWLRPNYEAKVQKYRTSVDNLGWRRSHAVSGPLRTMAIHCRHLIPGAELKISADDTGDRITAKVYLNLTGTIPMLRWSSPGHVWSYHEGSFYPMAVVLRFLQYVDSHLTLDELSRAENFPEEFWLQAWVVHKEPALAVHNSTEQLAVRMWANNVQSRVTIRVVEQFAKALDMSCAMANSSRSSAADADGILAQVTHAFDGQPYYAAKRFARNISDPITARALELSPCFRAGHDMRIRNVDWASS